MTCHARTAALAVAALILALLSPLSPVELVVPEAHADEPAPTHSLASNLALNVRGTAQLKEGSPPGWWVYTPDVYDLRSDAKIGTATHEAFFTSPMTADHVITFHLPDGDIVSHDVEAFAPDPTRKHQYVVGIHPEGNTIVAEKNTGVYAGRTGRLRMSGWHGIPNTPQEASFDDFYYIELEPSSSRPRSR